jgi:hypothetical protein
VHPRLQIQLADVRCPDQVQAALSNPGPVVSCLGSAAASPPEELSAYGVGDTLEAALKDLAEGIRALLANGHIPAELTREIAVTIGDAA